MANVSPRPRARQPRTWLQRYVALQARYDVRIDQLLQNALEDALAQFNALAGKAGIGAAVRRTQLTQARASLHRVLRAFWQQAGDLIRAGREDAAAAALEASFDWDETLLRRAFPDPEDRDQMRRYLVNSADRDIEAMLKRVFDTAVPLSQRVWQTQALANGQIDRAIDSGIARGSSAADIANAVRDFVNPRTPGGLTYASKRLGRTELNNAFHGMSIEHNLDKPWNTGQRWHTSGRHPKLDLCDTNARRDNGLGPGVFALGQVPGKPHPQCLCYITPETMSVDEFNQRYRRGEFDAYMQSTYGI